MVSKRKKKLNERIISELTIKEPTFTQTHPGKHVWTRVPISKKTRRHSGRYTPKIHDKMKFSEMIKEGLEPQEYYDEWINYRDGMRDPETSYKWLEEEDQLKIKEKIIKKYKVRQARKAKKKLKEERSRSP